MGEQSRVHHLSIRPRHPGQLSLAIPPWIGKMAMVTAIAREETASSM